MCVCLCGPCSCICAAHSFVRQFYMFFSVIFAVRTRSIVVQSFSLFHWASSDVILSIVDLIINCITVYISHEEQQRATTHQNPRVLYEKKELWSYIQKDLFHVSKLHLKSYFSDVTLPRHIVCRNWLLYEDMMLGTSAMNMASWTRVGKERDAVLCA